MQRQFREKKLLLDNMILFKKNVITKLDFLERMSRKFLPVNK